MPCGKIKSVTGSGSERQCLEGLIQEHVQRYSGFGPEDLAKLLYQSVMGMDHLLRDRARFIDELGREWEMLASIPQGEEALLDPVHPSDPIVRLNLRPTKAAGVSLTDLGALLAGQRRRSGRISDLLALWGDAVELARGGRIPFGVDDLKILGEILRAGNHPPGHSARYREIHQPAYRLLHDVGDPALRGVLAQAALPLDLR